MVNKESLIEKLEDKKYKIIKSLGEGGFGLTYEVKKEGKYYAAKIIKEEREEQKNEAEIIKEFRGQNIVKVNYVERITIGNDAYNVIVMEKAPLKSLANFIDYIKKNNFFDLIFQSPFEIISDNLMKYFILQLIQGLEILNRNNFCHFDIKPDNILIFYRLYLKWADFGMLRDIETMIKEDNNNNDKKIYVPGGTPGYFSPEFYQNENKLYLNQAFKHDYFALGCTIYYMKYGKKMLDFFESKDNLMTTNTILEIIEKKIDEIKSDKSSDKDFANFLCHLIQYKPEERADMEYLLRNKWINKDAKELENIIEINCLDERKLMVELNKSDFLIKKKEYLESIFEKNNKNENRKNKFVLSKSIGKYSL